MLHNIIIALSCVTIAAVFELAEQRSRAWYADRAMLRSSGFFLGLAAAYLFGLIL